jgi:hypothetical protein
MKLKALAEVPESCGNGGKTSWTGPEQPFATQRENGKQM